MTAFRAAAAGPMKGILGVSDEPLVSMDFKGDSRQLDLRRRVDVVLGGNMVKVIAWYDNEWGYSCRVADLVALVGAACRWPSDDTWRHAMNMKSRPRPAGIGVGLGSGIGGGLGLLFALLIGADLPLGLVFGAGIGVLIGLVVEVDERGVAPKRPIGPGRPAPGWCGRREPRPRRPTRRHSSRWPTPPDHREAGSFPPAPRTNRRGQTGLAGS